MAEPLSALLAAIPGIAQAGSAIANAANEKERNAQLIEFQRVIIQLQTNIAAVQIQNASLLSDKAELEKQIISLKQWEEESQKYELREVSTGIFARVEKGSVIPLKSAQKFCANCFEQREKRILQFQHVEVGRKKSLVCSHCKSSFVFYSFADES